MTVGNIDLAPKGPATIDVVIQPMVLWLWVGGAITAFGAALAAIPGRRRRRGSTETRGAPVPEARSELADSPPAASVTASAPDQPQSEAGAEAAPVGAGAGS